MLKKIIFIIILLVFMFLIFYVWNSVSQIKVVTTAPANNSTNTSLYPSISVSFSKSVSQELDKIVINISPKTSSSTYLSSDSKTLYIIPQGNLSPSTKYSINIFFANLNHLWSFTTTDKKGLSEQDKIIRQGQDDSLSARAEQEFLDKHPWYDKIPEPNESFFIGFDAYKEEFFVDLYPKKSSAVPLNIQEENLKRDVQNQLKQIGVNIAKYNIDWKSLPK